MPSIVDRVRAALAVAFTKSPTAQSSYGTGPYAKARVQIAVQGYDPRAGARMLRSFSRHNEWVRLAVNVRTRQISQAKWKLVRNDDPKKAPDLRVVKTVRELLRFVNPKRESFRSLLDQVIEDVLVLDAGCVEKEHSIGGEIVALWGVDGATIVPDPSWDGSDAAAPRYFQVIDGRQVAQLRNDQLIYIMGSPSTYSPLGWSIVETLVRAIEADLYGERYDFDMLKQAAPAGLLDLGRGLSRQELEAAREYYESDIAGTKDLMIVGFMGDPAAAPGQGGAAAYTPFARSNREQQRDFYKTWLVKKIACVFELDPTVFGITGDVNRSTSRTLSSRTDEGHVGLANLIAEFLTRELVWEIDERHDFEFHGIVRRDEERQAAVDKVYMSIGCTTPNEIRAREGLDPFPGSVAGGAPIATHWANLPYPFNMDVGAPQTQPDGDSPEDGADNPGAKPEPGDDDPEDEPAGKQEGAKSAVPFAGRRQRTASASLGYLNDFTR